MTQPSPGVLLNWTLVQGDDWSQTFPVFIPGTSTPLGLAGYTAGFTLRQNPQDATALVTLSSTASTSSGSIVILANAGLVTVSVTATATATLPITTGQMKGRIMYNLWIVSPTVPGPSLKTTIAAGAWYLRARV